MNGRNFIATCTFILCLSTLLQERAHAFFSHQYPSYYRRPHRPRYDHRYRQTNDYGHHKEQMRRQRATPSVQPGYGKEITRDLGNHIELLIPCGRYCPYYNVHLRPLRRGKEAISVKGQMRNGYRFGRVFYENEWVVPDDVDAKKITREITDGGYLKLTFPRLLREQETQEADVPSFPSGNIESAKDTMAHEGTRSRTPDMEPRIPTDRRRTDTEHVGHDDKNDQSPSTYGSGQRDMDSAERRMPEQMFPQSWKPELDVLEEYQPPYPDDPDIQIEDLECSEDFGVKDKKASIGYWMREKFVFY